MTDNLFDWIFHYNTHVKLWEAAKREHYVDLFSNRNSENVLKSSDINTLIHLIKKTDGNKTRINKFLKKYK